MIDKEFKTKWIQALLSPKFEQGKGQLRTEDNKFCCLGVACHLIAPTQWRKADDGYFHIQNQVSYFPLKYKQKINLSPEEETKLVDLNDDGYSFSYIANWIKKNL